MMMMIWIIFLHDVEIEIEKHYYQMDRNRNSK